MKRCFLWLLFAWCVVHQLLAESFTTNIVDGFATNITTDFVLGDTGPYNFLLITNRGRMTNLAQSFIGRTVEAHNNTAIVAGTGSVWHAGQVAYIGLRSPSNTLAVLGGADVRVVQPLAMGTYETASNNFLRVAGAGSTLTAEWLHFGTYGPDNQLLVEDGASVLIGGLIFNTEQNANGGRQSAIVRGAGTRVDTTNLLQLGNSPANTLWVLDGAELVSRYATIGRGRSSGNRIIISGPGTSWRAVRDVTIGTILSASNSVTVANGAHGQTTATRLVVGETTADNSYSVESGGLASVTRIVIGEHADALRNALLIKGSGSTLSNYSGLTVGQSGSHNSFVMSDGASAWLQEGFGLGMQFTSSNNHALATGTNTLWVANQLIVGSAGDFNRLHVENGAHLFASSLLSGGQGGSGNSTHVIGPGSLLSLTNALDLSGGNSLLVTNNARVESGSSVIGSYGPSNAALISRASWSNAGPVIVGSQASDNTLRLSEIGRLSASNLVIGAADNADRNRLEMSGKGTSLQILNDLRVGFWGDSNNLMVAQGARVSAAQLHVGAFRPTGPLPAAYPGDANAAFIHGTNTVVNVTSNLSVGSDGSWNRLELRAGAQLTSTSVEVALHANSTNNTILLSDPGTRWRNTNAFVLGSNGYRNTLVVSNGARLSTGALRIGAGGFPVPVSQFCTNRIGWNSVAVVGEGSVMEIAGRVPFSDGSLSNSIIVSRGGAMRMGEISFGSASCGSENSQLLLVDGGTLVITNRLYLVRGVFRLLGGRAEIDHVFVEGGPLGRLQVFGGTLRVGSIYASAPAEAEIGDGLHRATLELTGPNNFSSGRIFIASNSVLAGRSSIFGFTNAGTYGTLRGVTALTNAILRGSSGFNVWIQGTGPASGHSMLQLRAEHPVIAGQLRVAISPAFQPQFGDAFPIVTGRSAGVFENASDNSRINTVDNLGSFLVRYSGSTVLLSNYQSTDLDGDAIEDAWATNHFGHSPLTPAEKSADSDGDGMSNYDEFRAGTDPTNAGSALRITATLTNGTATLDWPCVDGKTYRVYFSDDMQTWREVTEPTFAFPAPDVCQWTDGAGSGGAQMRFYRVAVQ